MAIVLLLCIGLTSRPSVHAIFILYEINRFIIFKPNLWQLLRLAQETFFIFSIKKLIKLHLILFKWGKYCRIIISMAIKYLKTSAVTKNNVLFRKHFKCTNFAYLILALYSVKPAEFKQIAHIALLPVEILWTI